MIVRLAGTDRDCAPMTWGLQKKVFAEVVRGLRKKAEAAGTIQALVFSALHTKDLPFDALVKAILELPEIATEVLALGLGLPVEDLDAATGMEVLTAAETFLAENAVEAQWDLGKKVLSLVTPKADRGEPKKPGSEKRD